MVEFGDVVVFWLYDVFGYEVDVVVRYVVMCFGGGVVLFWDILILYVYECIFVVMWWYWCIFV